MFALISTRGMYDIIQASMTSVFELFCMASNLGVSDVTFRIFFIFESLQLSEFSTDLQDPGLYKCFIILETGLFSYESVL